MTQAQLDRSVARATGESLRTIQSRGFSVADPEVSIFDPEPVPHVIDWDALAQERVAFFPQRQSRRLAAA